METTNLTQLDDTDVTSESSDSSEASEITSDHIKKWSIENQTCENDEFKSKITDHIISILEADYENLIWQVQYSSRNGRGSATIKMNLDYYPVIYDESRIVNFIREHFKFSPDLTIKFELQHKETRWNRYFIHFYDIIVEVSIPTSQ